MTTAVLPPQVAPYAGRIVDCDSHELMPAQLWIEVFGDVAKPLAEMVMTVPERNKNHPNIPHFVADNAPIERDTIWSTKGPEAPAAADMGRRVDVMDVMGIRSQMLFATSVGLWGISLLNMPAESNILRHVGGGSIEEGFVQARRMMDAHNEWLVGVARESKRIKAIAPIYGDSVEELITRARWAIDRGLAGIWLTSGVPPAGLSPADNAMDPFYALLAEAQVALHFHISGYGRFLSTHKWGDAAAFEGFKTTAEISTNPWWLSAVHLSVQNFIAAMVTGGVFDRHPDLHVLAAEHGASWIGPLAQMLDIWHDNNNSLHEKQYVNGPPGRKLPMRPSEYIRRNVRVTPFDFEPIGTYLDHYGLDTVYCFASDYPHIEGGSDPMGKFTAQLDRHGPAVFEKFFVTNGEVLFPPV
jgi:predicted TIM-barrel fold metal-dependent hydrolase